MLDHARAIPTIPCSDLERSADFYANKLGLRRLDVNDPAGGAYFEAARGSQIYVYPRPNTATEHTLAAFEVDDIEKEVSELRQKGVKFEDYDIPEMKIKTTNGIATFGDLKTAWFKDPDGHVLAVESKTSG